MEMHRRAAIARVESPATTSSSTWLSRGVSACARQTRPSTSPSGGEVAGRSPVDRSKQGLKRSVLTEGQGLPVHLVAAGANRHDSPLLAPTLAGLDKVAPLTAAESGAVQLDRGYDNSPTRMLLAELGLEGVIARKGVPAPIQAGSRWKVERTHSWMNGYGKLRRCTEKRQAVVDFYLFLAAALVVLRRLIQEARTRYRWPGRPSVRRLT